MPDLPADVVTEVERLTRLARNAVDGAEAEAYRERREHVLAGHGYTTRYRDADDTLVLYPTAWLDDSGTVRLDAVETGDAVEVSLSGPGREEDYRETARENARVVSAVAAAYGDVHADNARALADFAENHYAKPIADLTPGEIAEFTEEYFVRNAWPTRAQREAVEQSLEHVKKVADDGRTSD